MDDPFLEINEVFTVSLSLENPVDVGRVELRPITGSVTILDNDSEFKYIAKKIIIIIKHHFFTAAVIGIGPEAYSIIEGTDQSVNFNVDLISGELGREVIVNFNTESVSATGVHCNYNIIMPP